MGQSDLYTFEELESDTGGTKWTSVSPLHNRLWDDLDLSTGGQLTPAMPSGASKLEYFWRFWPRSQLQDQVRAWKRAADEEERTLRGLLTGIALEGLRDSTTWKGCGYRFR